MNFISVNQLTTKANVLSRLSTIVVLVGLSLGASSVMAQNIIEGAFIVEDRVQDETRTITVGIPKTGLLKATRVSGWKARYDSVETAKAKSALISLNESTNNVQ